MFALVTGGAGFIGSALSLELLERGWRVRALDNLFSGARRRVPSGAELIEGDIRDLEAVHRAVEGVDVVFHQAAVRSVPQSIAQPSLSNEVNVTGTLNVLLAAEEAGVRRVVYASSSSVYGATNGGINHEDLPTNPISPYAVSKLAGEHYCRVWGHLGRVETVSLRYFNVFGPGQDPHSKYAAVFPAFVSALLGGRRPEVHWDGEQSRDFTYIDDVVRANLAAAEAQGAVVSGQVFNVGSGRPKTVHQVLSLVAAVLGVEPDPEYKPRRPGDVRSTHADLERAARLLGWKPEADWDDAVGQTVAWFREVLG